MGLFFPVYPPEDLAKLDQAKRKELATAIRQVLQTDPDVQKLLREKTSEKYRELIRRS
jgi:mRNA-degrading endonuclease RelE of RelBE toxin-antitoxin system